MRTVLSVAASFVLFTWAAAPAYAQDRAGGAHTMLMPAEVKWGPAPASLPPGAQAAVLYGDPTREGPFALRLKLPRGYHIPAHTHSRPEIVTVISGEFRLGMGPNVKRTAVRPLGPGGFFAFDPGMAHYAFTDRETVVQLNSVGPWTINYVRAGDDPRQRAR